MLKWSVVFLGWLSHICICSQRSIKPSISRENKSLCNSYQSRIWKHKRKYHKVHSLTNLAVVLLANQNSTKMVKTGHIFSPIYEASLQRNKSGLFTSPAFLTVCLSVRLLECLTLCLTLYVCLSVRLSVRLSVSWPFRLSGCPVCLSD